MLIWLAIHGLRSSRTFVVLVLAVALGAGIQIANDANLRGFESALLDDALAHGHGDVRVVPRDRARFEDGASTAATFAQLEGATAAVPVLTYPGALAVPGRRPHATSIQGVDAATVPPPFRIVEGAPLRPRADGVDVLLGSALAARLDVKIGDAVAVRAITAAPDPLLGDAGELEFAATVRGIVSGSGGAYRSAFVDREVLARLAGASTATTRGTASAASMIVVHLRDHDAARAFGARVEASHPDVEARAWADDDPGMASYVTARDTIGRISYAMVIAAIAIPMWALLYIHVLRKRRELAILAAVGFRRRELFALYTLQSAIVAVLGCALGAAIGYALIRYFQAHPLFQWETLVVRPSLAPASFFLPFAIIIATSVIAALHPAARAARVDPAQALRRIE